MFRHVQGRLSIINNYIQFVIIKAEDGAAYWVDISDRASIVGHRLGLPTPADTDYSLLSVSELTSSGLSESKWYGYRFTFANAKTEAPFSGIESKASTIDTVNTIGSEDAGHRVGTRITWTILAPDKATMLKVWRAGPADFESDITDDSVFRLVANHNITTAVQEVEDFETDTEWADNEVLSDNNESFPESVESITYYNGLLFAPNTDELRYNDRRLGISQLHIWPESKQLNYKATWALEYQGYLYFGDRTETHVLSGTGEGIPPFVIRYVDSVGALNKHCVALTEFGLTIISAVGIYVSAGSNFTQISQALDSELRHTTILNGSILQLPDRSVLFDIEFANGTRKQYMAYLQNQAIVFLSWAGVDMLQGVTIPFDTLTIVADHDTEWAADFTEWIFDSDDDTGARRTYIATTDGPRLSEVEWHREDTFGTDVSWLLESNDIFPGDTTKMARKIFNRLVFNADGVGEVDVTFDIDGTEINKTVALQSKYPTRIPIRLRGDNLRFSVSGVGNINIRGLLLEYEPLRNF